MLKRHEAATPLEENERVETKIGLIPADWELVSLDEITQDDAPIRYGVVQIGPHTQGGIPIVPIKFIGMIDSSSLHKSSPNIEKRYSGSRVRGGDVLLSVKGTIGEVGVVPEGFKGNIAREIARIRPKEIYDAGFVALQLEADHTQRRIALQTVGSTRLEFSIHAVRRFRIAVPTSLAEQRKIVQILSTWDEAADNLEASITAKEHMAAALRQQFFENEYVTNNRLVRARDIFEPVSERGRPDLPLLAVMQDLGIIRREELDRRVVMPDGDTSTYKVVREGDFVISLRSFEGGLEYSSVTGLVSPAYTVLRPKADVLGDYYRHFFKSRSFVGRLDKMIFGIRDGKQIAFRDFGDMHVPAPPLEVQKAQASALEILEQDLALEHRRLEAVIRQKHGLMQKLLTGQWRVTKTEQEEAPA